MDALRVDEATWININASLDAPLIENPLPSRGLRLYTMEHEGIPILTCALSAPLERSARRSYSSQIISLRSKSNLTPDLMEKALTALLSFLQGSGAWDILIEDAPLSLTALLPSLGFTPTEKGYAWISPAITFYTYRITSPGDPRYYIGRRLLHVPGATEEECLEDPYMGSGGEKYQAFVAEVGVEKLVKEVLEITHAWEAAQASEEHFVGNRYMDDPHCLNSIAGGKGGFLRSLITVRYCDAHGGMGKFSGSRCYTCSTSVGEKECPVHGWSKHRGGRCYQCFNPVSLTTRLCPEHGKVLHRGSACITCFNQGSITERECPEHGLVPHAGLTCCTCRTYSSMAMKECSIHGLVMHRGSYCITCSAQNSVSVGECDIHGKSKFQGGKCCSCRNLFLISVRECEVHGPSKHRGDSCMKCAQQGVATTRECPKHGVVKHVKGRCCSCHNEDIYKEGTCSMHGLTIHQGDTCRKCVAEGAVSTRECPKHGLVKHVGVRCYLCRRAIIAVEECPIHGRCSFKGGECNKCRGERDREMKECSVHGLTAHMHGHCMGCRNNSSVALRECQHHGRTKHRGEACCQCTVDRTHHGKSHGKKPREKCHLCSEEGLVPAVPASRECLLCKEEFIPRRGDHLFCRNPHPVPCSKCGETIEVTPRSGKEQYRHQRCPR